MSAYFNTFYFHSYNTSPLSPQDKFITKCTQHRMSNETRTHWAISYPHTASNKNPNPVHWARVIIIPQTMILILPKTNTLLHKIIPPKEKNSKDHIGKLTLIRKIS